MRGGPQQLGAHPVNLLEGGDILHHRHTTHIGDLADGYVQHAFCGCRDLGGGWKLQVFLCQNLSQWVVAEDLVYAAIHRHVGVDAENLSRGLIDQRDATGAVRQDDRVRGLHKRGLQAAPLFRHAFKQVGVVHTDGGP